MLQQHGASIGVGRCCCLTAAPFASPIQVYGVDVGYGQLADKVRRDPRVVVLERLNLRYLKPEDLGGCKVRRQQGPGVCGGGGAGCKWWWSQGMRGGA